MNFSASPRLRRALARDRAHGGGLRVVLLAGGVRRVGRTVPATWTLITLAAAAEAADLAVGRVGGTGHGALAVLDDLAISISLIAILTAAFCVLLSIREPAAEQAGRGEYHALLLGSVLGMTLLAQAQNLVTFFVAIETLSIPLYILCATNLRRERSLESGLKYLIVGSLGSATLLYGLAFIYGGSGSTDFAGIAAGIAHKGVLGDPLILIGIAMAAVGLAFKTSIAPFHQWTPDVYQGAPTPITAFMAVATKAAAFAVFVRFFDVALGPQVNEWQPALAVWRRSRSWSATSARSARTSLKRLLGYSGVAQAGYMLGGIVVASEAGVRRARLLPRRLRLDEPRRLRGGRRPRARDALRRRHPLGPRPGRRAPAARLAADDRDARPGRPARRPRASSASST